VKIIDVVDTDYYSASVWVYDNGQYSIEIVRDDCSLSFQMDELETLIKKTEKVLND
jgi:hypothetical protein